MEDGAVSRDMLNLFANAAKFVAYCAARVIDIGQKSAEANRKVVDGLLNQQCQWNGLRQRQGIARQVDEAIEYDGGG
jgi:hypothetical protein